MCIPAQETDDDLIIAKCLDDAESKIQELASALKSYAGQCDRQIDGRPESSWNCQGYGWIKRVKKPNRLERVFGVKKHVEYVHTYMNNVGMVECGGGPALALATLKRLNLL